MKPQPRFDWRHQYDTVRDQVEGDLAATPNDGEDLTQQQFKDKVNVNSIMAKYRKTGLIEHVRKNPGVYSDLTQLPDYMTAMQTVINANRTFETIPANVRLRFQNDPAQLISFLSDPSNNDEALKLGLIIPQPALPKGADIPTEPPKETSQPK